ncbi:hypothetical protein ACP70R_003278 [Stipagrostis hirtigluma subsp. patula]
MQDVQFVNASRLCGCALAVAAMAPDKPWPATRTASRCAPQTAQGTHAFEISQYSLLGGKAQPAAAVSSAAFNVGGYSWCIRCYPDGDAGEDSSGHLSVFLKLLTEKAEVRAAFDLRLVNQATRSSRSVFRKAAPVVFSTMDAAGEHGYDNWGTSRFIKRSKLEGSSSAYTRGDRLVIECDVTVIMVPHALVDATHDVEITPPTNLLDNFGRLLEMEEEADVTCNVGWSSSLLTRLCS